MKRSFAATLALAFLLLVLASISTSTLGAQLSPVDDDIVYVSPLATEMAPGVPRPIGTPIPIGALLPRLKPQSKTIVTHTVPFVNEVGETIIRQDVFTMSHTDPVVVNYKAQPIKPAAPKSQLLTFQSPLTPSYGYQAYLPIINGGRPKAQVLVIAYIGYTPTFTPTDLAKWMISATNQGTSFHGTGNPAIDFEMVGNHVEISNTRPPRIADGTRIVNGITVTRWSWDLWTIYAQHDICNRVSTEGIDEVWVYIDGHDTGDANYVYGDEWYANGPVYSTVPAERKYPPNCGKQMYTIGLNFNRNPEDGLESWAHSAEFAFLIYPASGYEACDFSKPYGYHYGDRGDWTVIECDSTIGYSAASGFEVLPHQDNGDVSVCGDPHFPPNIPASLAYDLPNPNAYQYDFPTTYPSRCPDWQWNILTNTVPVSGATWGKTQQGYLIWWLQHIPSLGNNLHGRDNSLRPNWWDFRLKP